MSTVITMPRLSPTMEEGVLLKWTKKEGDHVSPGEVIAEDARIGSGVSIGPLCAIGPGAEIGHGTILMAQVTVGAGARIGANSLLHPGVRVGERVIVGDRVILHHNASIGADGFSFITPEPGSVESAKATGAVQATNTVLRRINSLGTVILADRQTLQMNPACATDVTQVSTRARNSC